jgi:hypothetical protein
VSWDRLVASRALADALQAVGSNVTVLDTPKTTFNPPALVVGFPTTVTKHQPAFATDSTVLVVMAAVGPTDADGLDQLLTDATEVIEKDPTLGGAVQTTVVTEWRNWRALTVSGGENLVADLGLRIQM